MTGWWAGDSAAAIRNAPDGLDLVDLYQGAAVPSANQLLPQAWLAIGQLGT